MLYAILRLLLASLLLCSTAWATDYYANPTGSGSTCSSGSPCLVQVAVNTAQPGDRVLLQPGTYTTTGSTPIIATVRHGTAEARITITHSGAPLSAILDGSGSTTASGIALYHSYVTIDGLEIVDIMGNGIAVDGDNNGSSDAASYGHNRAAARHYYANGADGIIIKNCYIHRPGSTNDMIRGSRTNNYLVENNEISDCAGNANAIDLVGSYNAILKNNYIHDCNSIAVFVKGGSENIIVENNVFEDNGIGTANATLSLGQTTEWYNTRYTAASVGSSIHNALLEWTSGDNVASAQIAGTATGGNTTTLIDSGASFSADSILAGATVWKRVGIYFCAYGEVQSVDSATQITFTGAMTQYHTDASCGDSAFATGVSYQIDDPISDYLLYDGATMAECRNCTARGNLIINGPLPLQAQNCYNCDFVNNTAINAGGGTYGQGWVKLWNDDSGPAYWHTCGNVRLYNNVFYNDAENPVNSQGYVQDKQVGTIYPNNLTGLLSDYNTLYDATSSGSPGLGDIAGTNDTHSLVINPSLSAAYKPDAADDPIVDVGYNIATDPSSVITQDQSGYVIDYSGITRPGGSGYDMGAYEWEVVSDETAPTISSVSPSGAQSCTSDPRNVTESFTTSEAATCRAHDTETTWANMVEMTTTGGTTHSRVVSRACGGSYSPNFLCQDAVENESTMAEATYSVSAAATSVMTIGSGSTNFTKGSGATTLQFPQ